MRFKRDDTVLRNALETNLSAFWVKVYRQKIVDYCNQWQARIGNVPSALTASELRAGLQMIVQALAATEQTLDNLRQRNRLFQMEINREATEQGKRDLILEFGHYLRGQSRFGDKKALSRWFDQHAITERCNNRVKDQAFHASFLLGRLAALFHQLSQQVDTDELLTTWDELNVDGAVRVWAYFSNEPKVQYEALKSLLTMMKSLGSYRDGLLEPDLLRFLYRLPFDASQDLDLQVSALHIVAFTDVKKALDVIELRLHRDNEKEPFFFRTKVCQVLQQYAKGNPRLNDIVVTLSKDRSPTVRQAVIDMLECITDSEIKEHIITHLMQDESDAVFCYLVTQLAVLESSESALYRQLQMLHQDISPVRFRALSEGILRSATHLISVDKSQFEKALQKCYQILTDISVSSPSPRIQFMALLTREKIWAKGCVEIAGLLAPLLQPDSKATVRLTTAQKAILQTDDAKRWLAANIGHRFSVQLFDKYIYRKEQFGVRLWRLWHEFFHPATDKRQHHSHTIGRVYRSRELIPSVTLAEVSQTGVPGEPFYMEAEGHWRPFLPLVDQVISALQNYSVSQPTVIHHVAGKTTITPPASFFQRVRARAILTVRYASFAQLRNVDFDHQSPNEYVSALTELGFTIQCDGLPISGEQGKHTVIPAVTRFFELGVPVVLVQHFSDFQRYFVSVYQNTIQHIVIFSLFMAGLFWGAHVWIGERIKRARQKIPVSIGGWGTRGKSGTERLKAAVVNSVGLATVSKTTGCEAMFLFSGRYGQLREMFLFRPYDKATIWEQTFVTRIAARLGVDTLCWECMGLTPKYIDILQQQWMRDDYATITNCFPDHEDLQGPAGIDIPQVISRFIGPGSRVWTTEENMLAFLEDEAFRKEAELSAVDWLDIATIPEDLLERFPYQEHPANIALVARMAEELQVTRLDAIRAMADRVVADIGVLSVFPYSQVFGRRMRFINGMSANERYGAVSNWNRLGYDNTGKQTSGALNLITVINNRADRVPRSKVFARLIAYEFTARVHYVIGSNLDGFMMFAEEAWGQRFSELCEHAETVAEFKNQCLKLARFLLIPTSYDELKTRLENYIGAAFRQAESLSELRRAVEVEGSKVTDEKTVELGLKLVEHYETWQSLVNEIEKEEEMKKATVDSMQNWLADRFREKIILIDDFTISGNQINTLIARAQPKGVPTDIMGLQNIKGPGLDFVYTWQQWQRVHAITSMLNEEDHEDEGAALAELSAFPRFSCLDYAAVEACMDHLTARSQTGYDETGIYIEEIKRALHHQQEQNTQYEPHSGDKGGMATLVRWVEDVIDIFDAVRRGRKANRVLLDLAAERISVNKAVFLLMDLNKRQKGGWLKKKKSVA